MVATTFQARIVITPKPIVNDPQGSTVAQGLRSLGFGEVSAARVGKYVELTLEAEGRASARERVEEMCRKLLANGVIEDFHVDVEPGGEASTA